jgi:hypothetical protein
MGVLVWIMMGLALWHFTVFVPDRFVGGIVGAFLGALAGSVALGLLIHLGEVPGRDDTTVVTALEAIPGALLGMGAVYWAGLRRGVEPA